MKSWLLEGEPEGEYIGVKTLYQLAPERVVKPIAREIEGQPNNATAS
jgi:hypothetical protein